MRILTLRLKENPTLWDKTRIWLNDINPIYPIRGFFANIRRVIKWTPTIWKDRQYSHEYIYRVLYMKLKTMEEFYKYGNTMCVGANKRAHKIMIAKNLANRLSYDNYLINALYFHDKKFEFRDVSEWFEACPDKPGYSVYVEDPNKERENSFRRCSKHSDYMQKQDKEMLFSILTRYIEDWWD